MKIYLYIILTSFSFFACGGGSSQTGETFLIEDGQPPVSVLVAPTLNAQNTAEGVEVSWSDVSADIQHLALFVLERKIETEGEWFKDFATFDTDILTYTDTTVEPDITYTYRLRLIGEDDQMLRSEPVTIVYETVPDRGVVR